MEHPRILLPLLATFFLYQSAAARNGEWTHYGAGPESAKFADIALVDSANFDSLRIVWRWPTADLRVPDPPRVRNRQYRSTPIVVDGVLYTASPLNLVSALDAGTGRELWTFDPEAWKEEQAFFLGFARGVAHWSDGRQARILFGTADAYLYSLDAATGLPDPAFGLGGRIDLTQGLGRPVDRQYYAFVSPPLVCRDVVVVGSSGMDWRLGRDQPPTVPPGDVRGFDARTGKLLWTFHSPPRDSEFGADTWPPEGRERRGGANVWSMMSADEELGYVYLPFGTPDGDFYGGERPGDNLFGESLVCLDAATGERVWHYQLVHHGLWDYDIPAAPILADLVVDGRPLKAVVQVTKQAFCYVFDRVTGEPVWPIIERPVPPSTAPGERASPTQPFPTRPAAFDRQGLAEDDLIDFTPELRAQVREMLSDWVIGPLYTPPSFKKLLMVPGTLGGADWAGAALDPRTGVLFVPSKTWPRLLHLDEPRGSRAEGRYRYLGRSRTPSGPQGLPFTKPPYGRITAIDLHTGEHLWMVPTGRGPAEHPAIRHLDLPDLGWHARTFVIATPTLLLTTSERPRGGGDYWKEPEQELKAYDPASGRLLGRAPLPDYSYGAPMTYQTGDRQYIVAPVGRYDEAELVALAVPRPGEVLPPQLAERRDAEHARFYEAVALIDSGDAEGLRALLDAEPALATARGYLDTAVYGGQYYQGATLIHALANNPTRVRELPHLLEVADALVRAGADLGAQTAAGNTALSLAATSSQLRRQGVKASLIRHLLASGADPDDGRALDAAFTNYREPEMLDAFLEAGFPRDLRYAAALGEVDTLRALFDAEGHLLPRARAWIPADAPDSLRADAHALDLALSFAAYWGRLETARWLVQRGARINARPRGFYWPDEAGSTALHKAADAGRLDLARWLLAQGADPALEDLQWGDTPGEWSRYAGHDEVETLLHEAETASRESH